MPRWQLLPMLATALITFPLVLGQVNTKVPGQSDETISRQLVQRLLNFYGDQTHLIVGQLPKKLPIDLPLPSGAKVAASIIRDGLGGQENFQIFLDTNQSPEQVQAFYRNRLSSSGWQSRENFRPFVPKGFGLTNSSQTKQFSFCKSSRGPLLSITARQIEDALTDVRLNLIAGRSGLICRQNLNILNIDRVPMPNLPAPPKTYVIHRGSGGGVDNFTSSAILETELNSKDLATHYHSYFKQANWTLLDSQQSQELLWSLWTLKDQEGRSWQGILSLNKIEGKPNQYSASAIVLQL